MGSVGSVGQRQTVAQVPNQVPLTPVRTDPAPSVEVQPQVGVEKAKVAHSKVKGAREGFQAVGERVRSRIQQAGDTVAQIPDVVTRLTGGASAAAAHGAERTVTPNPSTAEVRRLATQYSDYLKGQGIDFTTDTRGSVSADTTRRALDAVRSMPGGNPLEFINTFGHPESGYQLRLASQDTSNNAYEPVLRELGRQSASRNADNALYATVTAEKFMSQFNPRTEQALYSQLDQAFREGRNQALYGTGGR